MIVQRILAPLVSVWIGMGVLTLMIMEEYLKKKCNEVIADVEALLKQLDSYKDSGWVLDFCDTLNKLSVTYWSMPYLQKPKKNPTRRINRESR